MLHSSASVNRDLEDLKNPGKSTVSRVFFCVTDKNKPPAMQVEGVSLDKRNLPCIINVGLQTTDKNTGGVPYEHRK